MTQKPHLDDEALAELQDVMDDEFEVLIHTFLSDSRERIESLKKAAEGLDADTLAQTAHSFKGSCINIGAPQLGELCREVENAAKDHELERAPAIISAIDSEFYQVSLLLDELLAG